MDNFTKNTFITQWVSSFLIAHQHRKGLSLIIIQNTRRCRIETFSRAERGQAAWCTPWWSKLPQLPSLHMTFYQWTHWTKQFLSLQNIIHCFSTVEWTSGIAYDYFTVLSVDYVMHLRSRCSRRTTNTLMIMMMMMIIIKCLYNWSLFVFIIIIITGWKGNQTESTQH